MNKRIKELYEQSLTHTTGKDHAGNPMAIIKQNPELFAELIVKECADVAWMNTPETEELEYSHLISNKIKQHFGVEE